MARQHSLSFDVVLPPHTYEYGERATGQTHGVVLTKPHVVRLILDLAQYIPTRNLAKLRLLEPSCGDGVFVAEAVQRLLASAKRHRINVAKLTDAVRTYDIDSTAVAHTKEALRSILAKSGVDRDTAETLVAAWVRQSDFLLKPIRERFDVIIGNPPYVRIEQLDPQLQAIYRSRFETLFDRADLYVAFIERSLELLTDSGVLSFICADRWTMNRYGAPLRELVAREYGVKVYVDLHQASPFESDVIAYPSIFVFERQKPTHVVFAKLRDGSAEECESLVSVITKRSVSTVDGVHVFTYERWFDEGEPWVLGTPEQLAVLRDLEDRFDTIEHDGRARVSIGVATGADEIFIVSGHTVDEIEPDRLVPLVMRSDICDGRIEWRGEYVINAFRPNGHGIDLADYPKLYLFTGVAFRVRS